CLGESGIGADRPRSLVKAAQADERPLRLAPQQQDPRALERELSIDLRRAALEQVVDVSAEPVGDDTQHSQRRLCPSELDLAQERPREVPASDLGQADAALARQAPHPPAQGLAFVWWHAPLIPPPSRAGVCGAS